MRTDRKRGFHGLAMLAASLFLVFVGSRTTLAQVFSNGDVFVAIGSGQVQWRHADGSLVKTLTAPVAGNNFTTGMAFGEAGDLFVTMFDSQAVAVFDNSGDFLQTFGSGYNSDPESIVIDASNNVYVGQADGSHEILKFDSAGTPVAQFAIVTDRRGSDWIDLAGDLCTMYYTSEGTLLKRFDVCLNQQLTDFNTTPFLGAAAYAHRLLTNGTTLVADSDRIVRLDAAGTVVQTYTVTNEAAFFALNLDPDGTSFWSADLTTGDVFKFDIATGNILLQFNTGSGVGTVAGITVKGELTASGRPPSTACATRNSRFWFTHAFGPDPACASLQSVLQSDFGGVNLGFLVLPAFFETNDSVKDVTDAVMEALGFYWKSSSRTGEIGGSQHQGLRASKLCKQRKLLAVEFIAAVGNVRLLGTSPNNCTYFNGTATVPFPPDLLHQARVVLGGDDANAIVSMRALLRKFNGVGLAGQFPPGIVECSPSKAGTLKSLARDATRQNTCPGLNNSCDAAQTVFFSSAGSFSSAVFTGSANLMNYTNSFPSPACGAGGRDAIWKITPTVGVTNRSFTVSTSKSNFDSMISVWQGTCSNLVAVSCVNSVIGVGGETINFRTDGTNTFYVVVEGVSGNFGKTNIKITSP